MQVLLVCPGRPRRQRRQQAADGHAPHLADDGRSDGGGHFVGGEPDGGQAGRRRHEEVGGHGGDGVARHHRPEVLRPAAQHAQPQPQRRAQRPHQHADAQAILVEAPGGRQHEHHGRHVVDESRPLDGLVADAVVLGGHVCQHRVLHPGHGVEEQRQHEQQQHHPALAVHAHLRHRRRHLHGLHVLGVVGRRESRALVLTTLSSCRGDNSFYQYYRTPDLFIFRLRRPLLFNFLKLLELPNKLTETFPNMSQKLFFVIKIYLESNRKFRTC